MISEKCIDAYRDKYPEDTIGFEVPDGRLFIESGECYYIAPDDETDEKFMERLGRCTKERNVFTEEWDIDNEDYSGVLI